jgi:hypothetical protein
VPTKKQRRRREKEQRHEYEYVYVDSEGQEVEVDEAERERSRPRAKSEKKSQGGGRRPRTLEPPSWRRSVRRGLIFGPLFLAMILLLNGSRQSLAFSIVNTLLLLAIFVPFSYFLDSLFWRSYQKRLGRSTGGSQNS